MHKGNMYMFVQMLSFTASCVVDTDRIKVLSKQNVTQCAGDALPTRAWNLKYWLPQVTTPSDNWSASHNARRPTH